MLDIITYIKEDLKKAGIKKYTLQEFHYTEQMPPPENRLDCTNAVIYVLAVSSQRNRPAHLISFDYEIKIPSSSGIKDVIYKFLNDVDIDHVTDIIFIKANFVK